MQTTNHLLLIRPSNFARASETVADNSFQTAVSAESFTAINERARAEFDAFVAALRSVGVTTHVFEDTDLPVKPDAVFPNNWFSTHDDGTVITYPVFWPQRRRERRGDIVDYLRRHFEVARLTDLSGWEEEGIFLESTGSVVLDRGARIAYACLSQRCTPEALHRWCALTGYRPISFNATDARGETIYHTNVMMAVGTTEVLVCLDAVRDENERAKLRESLLVSGKRIVGLSLDQIDRFAGNALEAQTPGGGVWIMSSAAFQALDDAQREALVASPNTRIVHADLATIEHYGGGSARCMLGEVFLNKS